MPGSKPTLITTDSGAQFSIGDAEDVWFPPFPLVNSYRDQLDVIKNLTLRQDDVILTGFPKSGSHWFYEILNMLLSGKAEYKPRGKAADMIDANSAEQNEAIPSPRVLNTHVLFRYLPREVIEKNIKVIVLLRNPKDVCVSLYHHMKDWIHGGYTGTWDSFFDIYMDTGLWYGSWFDTVLDWEREMSRNPDLPILLASYEDMLMNPVDQICRLSKFLGLDRSRDLCCEISEKCSFQQLSAASSTVKHREFPPGTWRENAPGFFRKGKIGDWKNWFSVAQNERFNAVFGYRMRESKIQVVFEDQT